MTEIRTEEFKSDVAHQIAWYLDESGLDLTPAAVDQTVSLLARSAEIGQRRFQDAPDLRGARSHPVAAPFARFRIFYEWNPSADTVTLHALISAARADATRRD